LLIDFTCNFDPCGRNGIAVSGQYISSQLFGVNYQLTVTNYQFNPEEETYHLFRNLPGRFNVGEVSNEAEPHQNF